MQYRLQDLAFLDINNSEEHRGMAQVKMQLFGPNLPYNLLQALPKHQSKSLGCQNIDFSLSFFLGKLDEKNPEFIFNY